MFDGAYTILSDIFYGMPKAEFQDLLQHLKADESHTYVIF